MQPKIGDIIEDEYGAWKVTHVSAILTPFTKAGQNTKIEGYQIGLVKVKKLTAEEFAEAFACCSILQQLGIDTTSVTMSMTMMAPEEENKESTDESSEHAKTQEG